jgi:hypothetical protein
MRRSTALDTSIAKAAAAVEPAAIFAGCATLAGKRDTRTRITVDNAGLVECSRPAPPTRPGTGKDSTAIIAS